MQIALQYPAATSTSDLNWVRAILAETRRWIAEAEGRKLRKERDATIDIGEHSVGNTIMARPTVGEAIAAAHNAPWLAEKPAKAAEQAGWAGGAPVAPIAVRFWGTRGSVPAPLRGR